MPTYLAIIRSRRQLLAGLAPAAGICVVFRVLKLVRYLSEANVLLRSMYAARRKVLVFFTVVLVLSVLFGSLMFLVEGPDNGFTSIPRSIYWTIVTITTVGYGDIAPQTAIGTGYCDHGDADRVFDYCHSDGYLHGRDRPRDQCGQSSHTRCNVCERSGHHPDAEYCLSLW